MSEGRRTRSLDRLPSNTSGSCYWKCGQLSHISGACSQHKDHVQERNGGGRGARAEHQPASP
ncbi:hypothetical protein E2C01_078615 [Portunus trituberculatus]|uniref:Uncharacterized protein n=1 Tax=Portunus trituberculatus TaxID=210409 RepID=A0A5B7IUL2_PORTR|nr:hypothetical protein [Portunus trituberculatus]